MNEYCPFVTYFPSQVALGLTALNISSFREHGELFNPNCASPKLPPLSDPHNERFSTKLYDCLPVSQKAHITVNNGS